MSFFSSPMTQRHSRSYTVWSLWIAYGYITLSGWVRMVNAITDWYWLNQAGITPGPLYLAVTGGLWGLVGLVSLVWIFFYLPWYRLVGLAAALFFTLSYWVGQLFAAQPPANLAFSAGFTIVCLGYVWLVLRPWDELKAVLKR